MKKLLIVMAVLIVLPILICMGIIMFNVAYNRKEKLKRIAKRVVRKAKNILD